MKRLPLAMACAALLLGGQVQAATVAGRISFVTKRGQNPLPAETLIWLEPLGSGWTAKKPAATYQMVTRNKSLAPHVLAVPAGSSVTFPNEDPISHNLFSLSQGNQFDLGLYRKGPGKVEKFDAPGVVSVYCNVHPQMSAVVHVMKSPFYAFADASGGYSIADVPPGKYNLVAWNEQGGTTPPQPVEVSAAGAVSGNVAVTLDTRNFRQATHMNKLGKPYQAPSSKDY
ncbi:MAG TPA: hypothetical protein VJ276_15640 [Thermoanaerobaculia bacterium]|nr:hypothetical protein [Thermoanaerobaculia bacterium]